MKGVINKGIQEMLEKKYGQATWIDVKERAGCDEQFFLLSHNYPDETTFALTRAAAEVLDLPLDTLLVEFGRYWVRNTAPKYYPTYFSLAGQSPRDVFHNLNRIHQQVTMDISGATPPKFQIEEQEDGKMTIRYESRRAFCAVLRGLILGVGEHYGQDLVIEETSCIHRGDPACVVEVAVPCGEPSTR